MQLPEELDHCSALVLGGGVVGLSTAIVLQSLGLSVAIVTRHIADQSDPKVLMPPQLASGYAMASAYPHNLRIENLPEISHLSQKVFRALSHMETAGVSVYHMFEVFENEPDPPPLSEQRLNFEYFSGSPGQLKATVNPPFHPEASYLWGWQFDTFFADMPHYLRFLRTRFLDRGGHFFQMELNRAHLERVVRGRAVANCLGLGARELFADTSACNVMRGKQIQVIGAPPVTLAGQPVAYNYTPKANLFSRADGTPEYVHFFPRSDGWILGQTREPGWMDDEHNWHGQPVFGEELEIGGVPVPKPILDVNVAILENWLGLTVPAGQLQGREGYRYYRDGDDIGVRLDLDKTTEACLVHNYGHGGSGVTMSWGCAIRSEQLLIASGGITAVQHCKDKLDDLLCQALLSGHTAK